MDILFNIEHYPFKLCEIIVDIIVEGTVSEIFYLGPSLNFM